MEWGTGVYLPSMARRLDDIFTSREKWMENIKPSSAAAQHAHSKFFTMEHDSNIYYCSNLMNTHFHTCTLHTLVAETDYIVP